MEEKRKISAKTLIADVRAGMTSDELMGKHDISKASLDKALGKLKAANLISDGDLRTIEENSYPRGTQKPFQCPSCGMSQSKGFDECPRCGIIVSKFVKRKVMPALPPKESVNAGEHSDGTPTGRRNPRPRQPNQSGKLLPILYFVFFCLLVFFIFSENPIKEKDANSARDTKTRHASTTKIFIPEEGEWCRINSNCIAVRAQGDVGRVELGDPPRGGAVALNAGHSVQFVNYKFMSGTYEVFIPGQIGTFWVAKERCSPQ